MAAVFKQVGVKQAHPHRFRHTLASELLGKGGKLEVVAAILGDTLQQFYNGILDNADYLFASSDCFKGNRILAQAEMDPDYPPCNNVLCTRLQIPV